MSEAPLASDPGSSGVGKWWVFALFAGAGAGVLLSYNVAITLQRLNWRERLTNRWALRYWEEASVAIRRSLDRQFSEPVAEEGDSASLEQAADRCKELVMRRIARDNSGFQPWRFWQTIPWKRFLRLRNQLTPVGRPLEDWGRMVALGGFQLLDGVAPFLVFWLAPLASLPILQWTAWEFFDAWARP